VPLPEKVLNHIGGYLHSLDRTNGFLLRDKSLNQPVSYESLHQMFKLKMEEVGIDAHERASRLLGFHALRHWCNKSLRGKVDESFLRLTIGHSSEAMTNRYDHVDDDKIQSVRKAQEDRVQRLAMNN